MTSDVIQSSAHVFYQQFIIVYTHIHVIASCLHRKHSDICGIDSSLQVPVLQPLLSPLHWVDQLLTPFHHSHLADQLLTPFHHSHWVDQLLVSMIILLYNRGVMTNHLAISVDSFLLIVGENAGKSASLCQIKSAKIIYAIHSQVA